MPRLIKRSFAFALLSVTLLSGCGKKVADENSKDEGAVPDVTVAKVKRAPLEVSITVNGNLSGPANRDAKVAALVAGRIAKLLVSEGDPVKAGQRLAQLENASLQDQVRQADAGVIQARANVENARISAQRNEGLLQRGIAARKEVEDARTQVAVNEGALKQAEATRAIAQNQLSRAEVRAPFDGTVVRRFLGVGDLVDGTGAQPIVEVANIDYLEMLGTVPAAQLNNIRREEFSFQTDAVPDETFRASVVAVLPAVDPATNNGSVRIRIDNRKHLLKVGQYLSLPLPLKDAGARLVVPKQAIYPDESGEPHVYVLHGAPR